MAIECGVIAALFILISVIFMRRKQKEWAFAALPLMIVPVTDFVMELVVVKMMKIDIGQFSGILVLLIAVAVSAAWIGAVSHLLKSKKTSVTYITIANIFNVLLAAILINTLLLEYGSAVFNI